MTAKTCKTTKNDNSSTFSTNPKREKHNIVYSTVYETSLQRFKGAGT